jgi:hypothetical protein
MRLVDCLRQACNHFCLKFEENYVAKLPGGVLLSSVGRIEGLGAKNGMLIFSNSRTVWAHRKSLAEADFGFSVLSDPIAENEFDSDSFKEMIIDWGWTDKKS